MSLLVNPYRELVGSVLGTFGGTPLLIGKVLSYADGLAVLEEPGGGRSTARGGPDVAVIGTNVYFRDGVIEAPAPAYETIDIIEV